MTSDLPVTLEIIALARRDGVPSVKAGEQIVIRLTRKLNCLSKIRVNKGVVYITNPFGHTIGKIPFVFGKTNFIQFSFPLKKTLLSGFYSVIGSFQEAKFNKITADNDLNRGPPENHSFLGYFHLEGGHPPIIIHRVNYRVSLKNSTSSKLSNIQVVLAAPPSLPPRQEILDLKFSPIFGQEQDDPDGNRWIRFSHDSLSLDKSISCGFIALVRSRAIRYNLPPNTPNPQIPQNLERFIQPENFIESHHHLIKDLVHDLVQRHKTPIQYVQAAMKTVTNTIRYARQDYERGAAFAIENRVGDCTEYAALFTALCRANRIPARLESGFAFNGQVWERHAWSQIWIRGQWIPVDPTWHGALGFLGVTNRHLPLMIGNWMDTQIHQELKISWQTRKEEIDGKKRKQQEPKIQTGWKVSPVVSIAESVAAGLSKAPVEFQMNVPDAVPRGTQLAIDVSLMPSKRKYYQLNQFVMTATLSDGHMDQVVAIEPLSPQLKVPANLGLKIPMPQNASKVTLNLQLWADQKPTSTRWQKTIGLV